jgi:hypothetical protein
MKSATEILDEIVAAVMPRQGVAIGLREISEPTSNWREGADPRLRPTEVDRLASIADLLHPTDSNYLKCGEAFDDATR